LVKAAAMTLRLVSDTSPVAFLARWSARNLRGLSILLWGNLKLVFEESFEDFGELFPVVDSVNDVDQDLIEFPEVLGILI
jgi:hypothetical protein